MNLVISVTNYFRKLEFPAPVTREAILLLKYGTPHVTASNDVWLAFYFLDAVLGCHWLMHFSFSLSGRFWKTLLRCSQRPFPLT